MSSLFDGGALRPVTVCGRRITHSTHVCAFFDSAADEMACVAPYFAEGLDNGELVFTIREQEQCAPFVERLSAAMGRDVSRYRDSLQFRQLCAEGSYLPEDGDFDARVMYRTIEEVLEQGRRDGYPRVRTCGDMNWAVRMDDINRLMEYEARVNLLTRSHDCTFMCVYDMNRFSGRTVMDVLSTHPMVVMNNRIYENPYYVEPDEFLRTLASRGSGRVARAES